MAVAALVRRQQSAMARLVLGMAVARARVPTAVVVPFQRRVVVTVAVVVVALAQLVLVVLVAVALHPFDQLPSRHGRSRQRWRCSVSRCTSSAYGCGTRSSCRRSRLFWCCSICVWGLAAVLPLPHPPRLAPLCAVRI